MEKQREEAIRRLTILEDKGMISAVKKHFVENNEICVFERTMLGDINFGTAFKLSELSEFPEYKEFDLKKVVADFEKEYNSVVYTATIEYTDFGLMLDLFCVSQYDDEWYMDNDDFEADRQCVYVYNLTNPMFSEYGTIGFDVSLGGVTRTY